MAKKVIITTVTELEIYENGEVKVISETTSKEVKADAAPCSVVHRINVSEKRYGILTFGKKEELGRAIPMNCDITVRYKGNEYEAKSHATTQGRIDRLTGLICENFNVGEKIKATYEKEQQILFIEKI